MRVLALSDIHENVDIVARLRQREANNYDLLIVAGDIGGRKAREICDILDTFSCPVAYVYGNHDYDLAYDFDIGKNGQHLHGRPLVVGGVCLVGFSGCPTNWGRNPVNARLAEQHASDVQATHAFIVAQLAELNAMKERDRDRAWGKLTKTAAFAAYDRACRAFRLSITAENRREIAAALRETTRPGHYNIIVTHERLTKSELLPEAHCLIHGHVHQFSHRISKGKRQLNVAALDKPVNVAPIKQASDWPHFCNMATGNYVTFEIVGGDLRNLTVKTFGWNDEGWTRIEGLKAIGSNVKIVGADPSKDTAVVHPLAPLI